MRKQFQGCLVGAVIGDCLGAPFEFSSTAGRKKILEVISPSAAAIKRGSKKFRYTDDTAMTKSVCASLLAQKEFDAKDMAKRFAEEFNNDPGRGYGGVTSIFAQWTADGVENDVFEPARNQYNGSGSYGNGAAMRVAPVALFCQHESHVIKLAKLQALLTHSAKHGYNGAILQALAIFQALRTSKPLMARKYIDDLVSHMTSLEGPPVEETQPSTSDSGEQPRKWSRSPNFSFVKQLTIIQDILEEKSVDVKRVVERLGNDVTAQEAVPAAIYCFLKNCDKSFEETIYSAISLGGDTDTVATMAGAIAGAYFDVSNIPTKWKQVCEDVAMAIDFADKFCDLYEDGVNISVEESGEQKSD